MARFLFLTIASLGLMAALGTVLSRNLVHAALYLAGFFFTIACLFVLLEAEFLAVVQVLIYIGAVSILLMFGIMLTRDIRNEDVETLSGPWRLPALFAALCVFAALAFGINNGVSPSGNRAWSQSTARPSIEPHDDEPAWRAERREAVNDMARVVGVEFMTRYAPAFEVAGLLLTAALVGAIALAHRDESEALSPDRSSRTAAEVEHPTNSSH